jgi:hypothetical protein
MVEQQILELSEADRMALRDWFLELESAAWDAQIEHDARAGNLRELEEKAREQIRDGQWWKI